MIPVGVSPNLLRIDAAAEAGRIASRVNEIVFRQLKRRGAVVGLSGGVDSSVVAYLCARALGKERVFALLTPGKESPIDRLRLGRLVADALSIRSVVEDVSPILKAAHSSERRDAALRKVIPEYGPGYKCRLVLPAAKHAHGHTLFSVVLQSPEGRSWWVSLDEQDYLGIVAASTFEERAHKMMEYYYADLLQYAVAGTPNRLEYDQGFFVKNGDGAADLKPIAHLYSWQVRQLAEYLGVPDEILQKSPEIDTYPLEEVGGQFYLMLPHAKMDLCLFAMNNGIPPAELGRAAGLDADQVRLVYQAIQAKRLAAQYLRAAPVLVEEVPEL